MINDFKTGAYIVSRGVNIWIQMFTPLFLDVRRIGSEFSHFWLWKCEHLDPNVVRLKLQVIWTYKRRPLGLNFGEITTCYVCLCVSYV